MEELLKLKALGYPALLSVITEAQQDVTDAKVWLAHVQAELTARLAPSVKSELAALNKPAGTVNMTLQGGMSAKGVVDKKIEWDSEKLIAIAQTMPWARVIKIFKIDFGVAEKIYEGIKATDEDLAAQLDKARTVKYGDPKITLSKEIV